MRCFLALLTLLMVGDLAFAVSGREEQLRDAEWISTGVGHGDLANYLSNEFCLSKVEQSLACLAGVQNALQKINPALRVTSGSLAPIEGWHIDQTLDSFGGLQLTQGHLNSIRPVMSLQELNLRDRAIDHDREVALRQILKTQPVHFDRLRTTLINLATVNQTEPALTFRNFMMGSLTYHDPFASLTPRTTFERQAQSGYKVESSLGLSTIFVHGKIFVKKVEGPAQAAGLRQGDQILSVNGTDLQLLSVEKLSELNKANSSTTEIIALRGSQKIRARLQPSDEILPVVSSRWQIHGERKILIVQLRTFNDQTLCQKFQSEINGAGAFDGLIIDLRNNGGGYLEQVGCVLGLILGPHQTYLSEVDFKSHQRLTFQTPANAVALPALRSQTITLLQNGHSASGSEVFVGALREAHRALVVGLRSYGKGSVSDGAPWKSNSNFILSRTGGLYFFKNGKSPNKVGIIPDFEVGWRSKSTVEEDFTLRNEDNPRNSTPLLNAPIRPVEMGQFKIKSCVDKNWLITEEARTLRSENGLDFQLLYAEEVSRCTDRAPRP